MGQQFEMNNMSSSHVPNLDAQDVKFGPVVAEWFVSKRGTRRRDALFQIVVEPETVVAIAIQCQQSTLSLLVQRVNKRKSHLPSPDTQISRLAKYHIVIHAAVRKRLEPYAVWC